MMPKTENEIERWKQMQSGANELFSWAQKICETLQRLKETLYDVQLLGDPELLRVAMPFRDRPIGLREEIADEITDLVYEL